MFTTPFITSSIRKYNGHCLGKERKYLHLTFPCSNIQSKAL